MLKHAISAVWCDDGKRYFFSITDAILVRLVHCARVKCRDLVVIQIGRNKSLSSKAIGYFFNMRTADVIAIKPSGISAKVITDRRHNQRIIFK